jgi:hypothetical protein
MFVPAAKFMTAADSTSGIQCRRIAIKSRVGYTATRGAASRLPKNRDGSVAGGTVRVRFLEDFLLPDGTQQRFLERSMSMEGDKATSMLRSLPPLRE